jgi:hypothetical protein
LGLTEHPVAFIESRRSQSPWCSTGLAFDAGPLTFGNTMSNVIYEVVEHDGGWAYKLGAVFSEPFPTHAEATAAAQRAAAEQRVPGKTEIIEFEDEKGRWHEEVAKGNDRPSTEVLDK